MPAPDPIDVWKRKLHELEVAFAISASAAQKFELKEQIAEAKAKIAELQDVSSVGLKVPADDSALRTPVAQAKPYPITPDAALTPRDLIYISYSHKDKAWHSRLRRILDADSDIRDRIWDDTKIPASADFSKEIDEHVARARVMVVLGSEHYFGATSGAAKCETKPALEAHYKGQLAILWFPVGAHSFSSSPLGHIMAATGAGAVPLERLSPSEQTKALRKVHQEVRRCLGLTLKPQQGRPKPPHEPTNA